MEFEEDLSGSFGAPVLDIITIHGLFQSRKSPWIDYGARSKWLRKSLLDDIGARILSFSYGHIIDNGGFYTRLGLQAVAENLIESIIAHRQEQNETNRPICFIANDFGGIVLKNALILASQKREKYGNIFPLTHQIIFLCCPHRASSFDGFVDQLAGWLHHRRAPLNNGGLVAAASSLATATLEINGLFLDTGLLFRSRVINVFSEHPNSLEQVFSVFTTTLGIPGEQIVSSTRPLAALLYGAGDDDNVSKSIQNSLQETRLKSKMSSQALQGLDHQLSFIPPTYPNHKEHVDIHILDWVEDNADFKKWINCSGPRILRLNRNSGRQTNPQARFLQFLERPDGETKTRNRVFCFQFHKNDTRFNNSRAMLASLVANATAHEFSDLDLGPSACEMLEAAASGGLLLESNLLHLLSCICTAFRERGERVIWVIWNCEGCSDSLSALVNSIAAIDAFSETPCRILLESAEIDEALNKLHEESAVVALTNDKDSAPSRYRDLCTSEIAQFMQRCPQLLSLSEPLTKLMARHRQSNILDTIVVRWACTYVERLVNSSSIERSLAILERLLSLQTGQLFQHILTSTTNREQPSLEGVLTWIQHSFRRLTVWELEDALALDSELCVPRAERWQTMDFAQDLRTCFSGLITVENNEVSFIHSSLRRYLSALADEPESHQEPECQIRVDLNLKLRLIPESAPGPKIFEEAIPLKEIEFTTCRTSAAKSHLNILRSLLHCLAIESDLALDRKISRNREYFTSLGSARCDLRRYAASHWLDHFRVVRQNYPKVEYEPDIKAFLDNPVAVSFWATLMASYEPEITSILSSYESSPQILSHDEARSIALALSAGSGLHGDDLQVLFPNWLSDNNMTRIAFLAAARRGQMPLVKLIIASWSQDGGEAPTAELLSAAAATKNSELIEELFNTCDLQRHLSFPRSFLMEAARLGVKRVIKAVVDDCVTLCIQADNQVENHSIDVKLLIDLFMSAIWYRQPDIIPLLISKIVDRGEPLTSEIAKEACRVGESRAVQYIFNGGFDKNTSSNAISIEQLFNVACTYGNPNVVEELAKAVVFAASNSRLEVLRQSLEIIAKKGFNKCAANLLVLFDSKSCSNRDKKALWEIFMISLTAEHIVTCQTLIDAGIDPNFCDLYEGEPVLSLAVQSGRIDLVQLLLNSGTPLEVRGSTGSTSLYLAMNSAPVTMAAFLLKNGAEINSRANFGGTPLYQACFRNRPEMVELLLENGADIHISTYERNWSALEVSYDFPKVLQLIIDKSPDFKRVSSGATALWYAAYDGIHESVDLLLGGDPDLDFSPKDHSPKDDGLTPLAVAVRGNHTKVVRLLLEAGANINHVATEKAGRPILSLASTEEVIIALLEYNPNLELTDRDGNTTLHNFCYMSNGDENLALVKRLVNAGANVQALNLSQKTPLIMAITEGNLKIASYLISKGADPNHFTRQRSTALHQACRFGSLDAVKLLVEKGATTTRIHPLYGPPLAWAFISETQQFEKIQYLVGGGHSNITTGGGQIRHGFTLNEAYMRCDLQTIKYLVQNGGNSCLLERDSLGRVPIFFACYRMNDALEVVKYLKENGASISANVRDNMGRTALHCAVATNNVMLIKQLIEWDKTLLYQKDYDGWTPVHWATRTALSPKANELSWARPSGDKAEIVRLLLEHSTTFRAELHVVARAAGRGWTPLKLANYLGVYEQLQGLLTPPCMKGEPEQYQSEIGYKRNGYCDACFCELRGLTSTCENKACDFDLCFKCVKYKSIAHDSNHYFHIDSQEFTKVIGGSGNENIITASDHMNTEQEAKAGKPIENYINSDTDSLQYYLGNILQQR